MDNIEITQTPWESVHARMYHIGHSPIQTCVATNVVQNSLKTFLGELFTDSQVAFNL